MGGVDNYVSEMSTVWLSVIWHGMAWKGMVTIIISERKRGYGMERLGEHGEEVRDG